MAKTKYSELLRDPRWQKKRLKILERDGWMCQWCGSDKEQLTVHHTHYKRKADGKFFDPWDYPNDSLMTLCVSCHDLEQRRRKSAVQAFFAHVGAQWFLSHNFFQLAMIVSTIGKRGIYYLRLLCKPPSGKADELAPLRKDLFNLLDRVGDIYEEYYE